MTSLAIIFHEGRLSVATLFENTITNVAGKALDMVPLERRVFV